MEGKVKKDTKSKYNKYKEIKLKYFEWKYNCRGNVLM